MVYCMQEAHNGVMPPYFRFLTIMAFYVFLQEQVILLHVLSDVCQMWEGNHFVSMTMRNS